MCRVQGPSGSECPALQAEALPPHLCPLRPGWAGWAGTGGGWGRGKQVAEQEQLPQRLLPAGLAVRQSLGFMSGRWGLRMAPAVRELSR